MKWRRTNPAVAVTRCSMERPKDGCELCHHEAAQPGKLLGAICREAVERAGLAWRAPRRGAIVQVAEPAAAVDARYGVVAEALSLPEDTQFLAQQRKGAGIASRRDRSAPWPGAKEGRHRVATQ